MKTEIYENSYQKPRHFSFGRNWQKYLEEFSEEKLQTAKKSLVSFLGGASKIRGKSFVDVGCGSGLFSLAAVKLGAEKVVSFDADEYSVACANALKAKFAERASWTIQKGSVLDAEFLHSLGNFDVVYAWGVLHHTGNMYQAFKNVLPLIKPEGVLYLAIYNNNETRWLEGTSRLWLKIKCRYNQVGRCGKELMEGVYIVYVLLGVLAHGRNPVSYVRDYSSRRGMSFYTDISDWLGGHPYEFASASEVIGYFKARGLGCIKTKQARSIGCNEYLFRYRA